MGDFRHIIHCNFLHITSDYLCLLVVSYCKFEITLPKKLQKISACALPNF